METSAIGEVIGGAVVAVAPLAVKGFRRWLWAKFRRALGQHERYITQKMVESELEIYGTLTGLLSSLGADRAYVFQFHNGAIFSFRNPVWKLSCTHPAVRPGYSKDCENMRDVIASTVIELIAPLYGIYGPGTHAHPCSACQECSKQGRGLAVFDVEQMPETTVKGTLLTRGIRSMVFTPLIHDGGIGGFMGLDFCSASAAEITARCLSELCKASTRVASMLEAKGRL